MFSEPPPADVLAFNDSIADAMRDLPRLWDVGPERARQVREEGKSIFGELVRSSRAETLDIPGPTGPISLRVLPAEDPRGVFFHIHGGGWVLGAADHADPLLERLVDATSLTVVAVDYRLAPEHPYPAGPDDCEAAAMWLVDNAAEVFGTDVLAIGGESAGAHLSVVTMVRLRDRIGGCPFLAAALLYGAYDLRGTPSTLAFGDQPLVLNTPNTRWFVDQFAGSEDLTDPDISPMFADLAELPPALFLVGTMDPLIDDSMFMQARWAAAGNTSTLEIWPGAIHAFDFFETDYGRAGRDSVHRFLLETVPSS